MSGGVGVTLRGCVATLLLCCSAVSATAACAGHDLFPRIRAESPAIYAGIQQQAATMPFGHGRLFQVTKPGSPPSYVYGTLHLPDPRVTAISPRVDQALARSSTLVLEMVESEQRTSFEQLSERFRARPGRSPEQLLRASERSRLEQLIAARGLPRETSGKLSAAALSLLLDLPPCATRRGGAGDHAEQVLIAAANDRALSIVGLETIEEQIEGGSALSANVESALLTATITQAEQAEDVVETNIARWMAYETGALLAWMRSPEPLPRKPESRLPPVFLDLLVDARSRRMYERALPHIDRGGAFISVGAAHLPDAKGLLNLLRGGGMLVDRIE